MFGACPEFVYKMKKFIVTKKLGMSQLFDPDGTVHAVTVLDAEPNVVTQVRTKDKDGYSAVQLGFEKAKEGRVSKAEAGHSDFRHLREFRVDEDAQFEKGATVDAGVFEAGEQVQVSSVSIGRGFQGVVKRHGFSGGPASHGHGVALRAPGSIGSAFPQRVLKGLRMAGRMGGGRVSTKNVTVARVDAENNMLFLEGAVPGKKGSIVEVYIP